MKHLQQEHFGGTGLPKHQGLQFQLEAALEGARDAEAACVGCVPGHESWEAGADSASVPRRESSG